MRVTMLVLLADLAASGPALAAPADAFGVWITGDGSGRVEVTPCGPSACGAILGGTDGSQPRTDAKNPNRALRNRPLIGLRILDNFTRTEGGWVNGRIYDPNSGNTYRSELLPQTNGTMLLKGCFGPFCRTETWRRAS